MAFTPEDKLRFEIEKLQLDIQEKKRAFFNQPSFWIPVLTVAISLSGNLFQWSNSKNEKTLVDIQIAQAKLDKQKADDQLKALQQQIDAAQAAFESTNQRIADAEKRLQEATEKLGASQSPQVAAAAAEAGRVLADARQINQRGLEGLRSVDITGPQRAGKNTSLATTKEREGFEKLIAGDYDGAAQAFQDAENALSGFHSAYELSRLIRSRRSDLNDPAKRKEVFQIIVNKLSFGAPPEVISKMKELSK
ncbi:MAG: hypothetical protein ABIU20_04335 [Blastocatellia bacterium]